MIPEPTISKSQYLMGLQCPLRLWYYRYRKDLKTEIDSATQMRFDVGYEVGLLAQRYFSSGVKITEKYWDISKAEQMTKQLIAAGHEIIFEATALHPINGSYGRIDILRKVPNADTWDLVEVKSSTGKKEYHIDDMAFQYQVFNRAGYEINDCILMLLDTEYVRHGDITPSQLFRLESVHDEVLAKQNEIATTSSELIRTLNRDQEPMVDIGARCFNPFECEYRYHCWKNVPNFSIYDVYPAIKADEVYRKTKSYDISDIPTELIPASYRAIDINCYKNSKAHIEKDNLKQFISSLIYPLYYLDYETLMSAIPLYDGTRPYQQVPFQFSLHVQDAPNEEIKHFEFLYKEQNDPRHAFIVALLNLCGQSGSVVVYNESFEINRNKELARDFPGFAEELEAINGRIIDLMEPFQKRWLYKPEQFGSHSIKNVLPAYIPDLSYTDLKIAGGEEAMNSYIRFVKGELSDVEIDSLWTNLSTYCELDTFAMVRLLDLLRDYAK
jgi:Domain of unknown function(DUF2779)